MAQWQNLRDDTPERAIIHFTQTGCHCNNVSQRHIDSLNKQANASQFSVSSLQAGQLEGLIPATPAVAIIDQGKLVYFGPYGQGIGCSQTSGFAQTVLNNLQKGFAANLVVSDARGCYCNT